MSFTTTDSCKANKTPGPANYVHMIGVMMWAWLATVGVAYSCVVNVDVPGLTGPDQT